ncbi:MAG: S-layer homology domain-containing protein, partial [Oscillospiraceae bacterium]|nr:S-layer homology domain-containing protein [Oscillospiraceae bacterium]
MKKRTLSFALALCMVCAMLAAPAQAAFTDVHDTKTALAAATLASMGIAEGTGTNSFSPSTPLTRAQFCAFAVRAMGLDEHAEANGRKMLFSDVRPGSWYTGYVNLAYTKGAVNGYGDGRFGPDDGVTYAQVITILLRMLGYTQSTIGNLWPDDYIAFAETIDLDEGVSLGAHSAVTRGDAAVLLCNMLREEIAGTPYKFYEKMPNVASTQEAIVLDTDAVSGGKSGYLKVCSITAQGSDVSYFAQKETVSSDLCGAAGVVLFNGSGEVVGFVPDEGEVTDVTVDSASPASIKGADGITYRIAGGARVIAGGELYPYASSGYLQVDAREGESARLFRDDAGKVEYVYLSGGASASGEEVFFAETENAAQELAAKLGIS